MYMHVRLNTKKVDLSMTLPSHQYSHLSITVNSFFVRNAKVRDHSVCWQGSGLKIEQNYYKTNDIIAIAANDITADLSRGSHKTPVMEVGM